MKNFLVIALFLFSSIALAVDTDGDGVDDTTDNCLLIANLNQLDSDTDGMGDMCDITPLPKAGYIDTSFDPGIGANSGVESVDIGLDGAVIIGGTFSNVNNTARAYTARLAADGSLDSAFASPALSNYVYATEIQADGKVIIGGRFSSVNGISRPYVARLDTDGSLDSSFDTGLGPNAIVTDLIVQADGKIIICGSFKTINNISRKTIARLNTNGSLDTGFDSGEGVWGASYINAIAMQPDGKIIIGGGFIEVDNVTRGRIARLHADGSLDYNFYSSVGADNTVYAVAVQPDGKIIIAGDFTSVDGTAVKRIARLYADGSLDNTFNPGLGANNTIYSIALQSDGKIIIGGKFTNYNGIPSSRIVRLNANGTLDEDFNAGNGINNDVYVMDIQSDGKVIIGGIFTNYNFTSINRIARIHSGDPDSDGIEDAIDNCSMASNISQVNADGDSAGDDCDAFINDPAETLDTDGDTVGDNADNCTTVSNASQLETDGDLVGDACDAFPNDDTETVDTDGDGVGDNSDVFPNDPDESVDDDFDGVGDNGDNCLFVYNPDQLDSDNNGFANACDPNTDGKIKGDQLGAAVGLVDINNDGYADVIYGTPFDDIATSFFILKDAGSIYIASGTDPQGWTPMVSEGTVAGQRLGSAFAAVPDQNSDGIPDLVVGNPLADRFVSGAVLKDAGNVSLYSGEDGAFIQSIADGVKAGDHFGAAIAAGDVDNDGGVDLIVGAPLVDISTLVLGKTVTLKDAGRVTVFDGIGNTLLYTRDGVQANERFGSAVVMNKVDHQLLIGSPGFDITLPTKLVNGGRVQIFDAADTVSGTGTVLFTKEGEATGDLFGSALGSFNQDLDGDTYTDWVVGIPGADVKNNVTLVIMKDAGKIQIFSGFNKTMKYEKNGLRAGDFFGAAVCADGDINADGINDVVIGIPKFDAWQLSGTKFSFLKDTGRVQALSGAIIF